MAAWLGLKKYLWSNTMRVAYRVWPFSEFTSSHQNFTHSLGWISKFINGNRWRQWFKWWVWFPGKIISTLVSNFTSGRGIAIAIIISLNAFTFCLDRFLLLCDAFLIPVKFSSLGGDLVYLTPLIVLFFGPSKESEFLDDSVQRLTTWP